MVSSSRKISASKATTRRPATTVGKTTTGVIVCIMQRSKIGEDWYDKSTLAAEVAECRLRLRAPYEPVYSTGVSALEGYKANWPGYQPCSTQFLALGPHGSACPFSFFCARRVVRGRVIVGTLWERNQPLRNYLLARLKDFFSLLYQKIELSLIHPKNPCGIISHPWRVCTYRLR